MHLDEQCFLIPAYEAKEHCLEVSKEQAENQGEELMFRYLSGNGKGQIDTQKKTES